MIEEPAHPAAHDEAFETDIPRYTLPGYLRDRWQQLLCAVLCLSGVAAITAALGVGAQACVLATGFVALCLTAMAALDYARRVRFYRELALSAAHVGRACQLPSLLEEPSFLEGVITYEALGEMAKLANIETSAAHEQLRAHREYVELWIHEAKTPLAAAKLVLATMHGQQATKLKSELERIEMQLDQALYAARSTTLTNDYAIADVNLAAAVGASCKRCAHFLIERGTAVRIDVPPEVTVLADKPWLVFMLGQVVVNAAKYGAHSVVFSVHDEDVGTPRGRTVLEVRDDGCGIPAADVPRVFDRGFTGAVGREQGSATGMGLYLVAVMCDRMGLGVGIASEEGVGTRVLLSFPHDRSRADVQGARAVFASSRATA